jgi:hypothetical protein
MLRRSKATDVALERVESPKQAVHDPQAAEDAQQVLRADAAVAPLESRNRVAGDAGPVRELSLGQAAQAAPNGDIIGELAKRTANSGGDSMPLISFSGHI